MRISVLSAVLAAAVLPLPASAQNYGLNPSFGTVTLNAGFTPDPHTRTVRGGGDNRFTGGGGCPGGGWFANAPDYRINYRSGGFQLAIYVRAPGDTMLLVNDPNGEWYCNDDFEGVQPALVFDTPLSGQYDIWVGTYNRSRVANSTIFVTEMGPFSR